MNLEEMLLKHLGQIHGYNNFIDLFFILLANYSSYIFAVIFFSVFSYQVVQRIKYGKNFLWSSLLLLPTVLLVNYLLRLIIARERPFAAIEEFSALIYHYYGNSFPSNHAAASFAIAGTLYLINPLAGKVSFILALLVSFSRIYVGVHYPTDVLAGGFLAVGLLGLTIKNKNNLENWLQHIERRVLRIT